MKLSETTIDILSNFATINPNMLFKEGTTLSTISEAKNIMASATIEERIPREFGIYDLSDDWRPQRDLKPLSPLVNWPCWRNDCKPSTSLKAQKAQKAL